MVAKAGLGLVGLGAIGIGGVAFAKPEWLGINKETPWTSLAKDHDYDSKKGSDYQSTNFGGKYKYYLVGVVGTKNANQENTNKAMWEELFKKWEDDYKKINGDKSSLGKEFKDNNIKGGIKIGTDANDNNKYLNTVCEAIYKSAESEITTNAENNKYKESSVWKYCSPLGQKPTTVKDHDRKADDTNKKYENGDGGDKIGKKQESTLISVFDKGNDVFWNIRNKEIKDEVLSVESAHTFFKKVKDENRHIKDLCSEAYEKSSTSSGGSSSPTADETKKYCSLERE